MAQLAATIAGLLLAALLTEAVGSWAAPVVLGIFHRLTTLLG